MLQDYVCLVVIKNAIFYRKKSHSEGGTGGGNRMQQDGRSYSSALSDTGRRRVVAIAAHVNRDDQIASQGSLRVLQ